MVVIDNVAGSTSYGLPLFAMSGDGKDDVGIPVVFLFEKEGKQLVKAMEEDSEMKVIVSDGKGKKI